MHRFAPVLSALAFAGCATNTAPVAIPERSERYEFASATTPHRLASCAALNARIFSGRFASDVDQLVRPDNFQVTVRPIQHLPQPPIIVGRTSPVPGGAQIAIYMAPELTSTERADWIERLRKGCESDIRTAILVPVAPRETLPVVFPPPAPSLPTPPPPRQPRG